MKLTYIFSPLLLCVIFSISCKEKKQENNNNSLNQEEQVTENIKGFGILDKVKGIWDGPITSTTALGSFPKWIVDFRPISASQISAKNELNELNDIHMSFFVTKYQGKNYVAFKNGGLFNGNSRISYFLADSVSEVSTHSYYRFSEVIKGKSKAYTELIFKGDSLTFNTYTNRYNTQSAATPHMTWKAKRKDLTSSSIAASLFNFPQKVIAKDFTGAFQGIDEAVFYNADEVNDPYKEDEQPYLGKATVTYSFSGITPNPSNKTFLLLMTQPLFSPTTGYNPSSMNYISRYVALEADDLDFTFSYMHPGFYYVYAIYDANNDGVFGSGDYINFNEKTLSLSDKGNSNATAVINFQIP